MPSPFSFFDQISLLFASLVISKLPVRVRARRWERKCQGS